MWLLLLLIREVTILKSESYIILISATIVVLTVVQYCMPDTDQKTQA